MTIMTNDRSINHDTDNDNNDNDSNDHNDKNTDNDHNHNDDTDNNDNNDNDNQADNNNNHNDHNDNDNNDNDNDLAVNIADEKLQEPVQLHLSLGAYCYWSLLKWSGCEWCFLFCCYYCC